MRYVGYYTLFFSLFLLDRITKWIVISSRDTLHTVTSWLACNVHLNRGVSWGILHSHSEGLFACVTLLVILITCGVAMHAVYQWYHGKSVYGQVMILAGSISNIVDRMVYGGVIDFVQVHIGSWSFPTFNIADIAIVLGVCIMIAQEVFNTDE